jgi:hypothetical protein
VKSADGTAAPVLPAAAPARHCGKPSIARPLIIVCAPRSGSTLLFERLSACSPDWYTVGHESHIPVRGNIRIEPCPARLRLECARTADATPEVAAESAREISRRARDREGRPASAAGGAIRLLGKNAEECAARAFLRAVFPTPAFCICGASPRSASPA